MKDTLLIKVRCFSQVKYALEKDKLTITLPVGSTTGDLENTIRQMAKNKLDRIHLRVAVNQTYIDQPVLLKDGDEVALIPPVQGG